MPIGEYSKDEVRAIAKDIGLSIAAKPDSQDICFVPDGNYADFILSNSKSRITPGNFVDTKGNVLGKHKGIVYYTVGQRRGLGIASDKRLYVVGIRSDTNEVILGEDNELMTRHVVANDFNFRSITDLQEELSVVAKIRYNHKGAKAILRKSDSGLIECIFEEPQRAPTPGQAMVCYQDNYVVGGGIIVK